MTIIKILYLAWQASQRMIEQRALHVLHWWLIRIQSCTPIPSIYLWRQHITSKLTNYNRSRCCGTIMLILPTAAAMIEQMTCNVMHCWRSAERIKCPIPSIYIFRHHIISKVVYHHRNLSFDTIISILPIATAAHIQSPYYNIIMSMNVYPSIRRIWALYYYSRLLDVKFICICW